MERRNTGRDSVFRWVVPLVLLIVGSGTSVFLARRSEAATERLDRQHYAQLTADAMRSIESRVNTYEEVLTGGTALFAASDEVTRTEWADFAATTQVTTRYPELIGLGVVLRIPPEEQVEFENAQREAEPGFVVYPVPGGTSTDDRYVITYLEPVGPYRYALGLDIRSEALRRFALERSRDSGRTAISDPVVLTGGTGQSGFLMLKPFYTKGADISTIEERQAALVGWVYAPFYEKEFFSATLGSGTPELDIRIYNGSTDAPAALAYSTNTARREPFHDLRPMPLKGQLFSISFARSDAFIGDGDGDAAVIVMYGSLASVLLAFASWLVLTSRVRAVNLAMLATEELEEALEALLANATVLDEQASEIDAMRVRAEHLASHDALTGLLNRRAWWETGLNMELTSIALIDIDHFKQVNDDLGHPAGDVVLTEIARRLAALVDERGVLGRLGGEEFGILFDIESRAAQEVLSEVIASLPQVPVKVGAFALHISASGGLAFVTPSGNHEDDIGEAYEAADAALYQAKSSGRAVWKTATGRAAA